MINKNIKFIAIIFSIFIISLSVMSCVSANLDYSQVDSEINQGNFDNAIKVIKNNSYYYYSANDKVLSYLDAGILLHLARNYDNSNENLQKAEVEIEKNFAKSISQSVGQILVNDGVADYPGETYEDIYTNIFKCLNYIHLNKLEDAMVEIRRFDNKMKVVGHEYQGIIDRQKLDMTTDIERNEFSQVDSSVKFHNSALARYLSMLLYRTEGDYDSARIDYEKINDAYRFQPELYNFSMPTGLKDELVMPEKGARVNVISFTGKGPVKYEEVCRIPLESTYVKFAIPVLERRPTDIRAIQVVFTSQDSGLSYKLNLHAIESIENIAADTYKQHFAAIYARAVTRCITKAVKTGVYDAISRYSDDSQIRGIFSMLNLFSRVSTEVTETADTRISRYFPGYASIGGITIPEGQYTVSCNFYNSQSRRVYVITIPDYEFSKGKLNLLEFNYLR